MKCPICFIGDAELYLIETSEDLGFYLGFYCNNCKYSSKIIGQEKTTVLDRNQRQYSRDCCNPENIH